jgi:hypothetical protein
MKRETERGKRERERERRERISTFPHSVSTLK